MSFPPNLDKEDIGLGVWFHRVKGGIIVGHTHENGEECYGAVLFDVPEMQKMKATGRPLWTVVSEDPLTIKPSINNEACGLHGFITDGKWVPA